MHPKHLIPGLGNPETMKRFRELEKRAGTLPVLFALFASEGIKIAALGFPNYSSSQTADIVAMALLAVVTGVVYVYDLDDPLE